MYPSIPGIVVKQSLHNNAAAILIIHNPSEMAESSDADRLLTQRLSDALALVGIRTLDHFVVASTEVASFAERGLLLQPR